MIPKEWLTMCWAKQKAVALLLVMALLALLLALFPLAPSVSADPIVSSGGWGWQNPLPQGNGLLGTWGSSPSDVFTVGYGGTILHYNGSAWGPMTSGTANHLRGVWGSSSSDVFAVGGGGTILHYPDLEQQAPTITSVIPDEGNHGETLDVAITGTNFTGATAVSFGSGITVNRFMVNSSSQITANIAISSSAMLGAIDVSVTSPGGTATKTGGFAVNQVSFTITSVSPNQGNQGETLDVTITGTNFTGATAVSFGSGITVNSFTASSSNQITANITISSLAMLGSRDVSVTTPGNTAIKTGSFSVAESKKGIALWIWIAIGVGAVVVLVVGALVVRRATRQRA